MFCNRIATVVWLLVLWGAGVEAVMVWRHYPPSLRFSNSSGAALTCTAEDVSAGSNSSTSSSTAISISWLDGEGAPLMDLPSLRSVYSNGSLVLHAFGPQQWAAAAHATVYRCRAALLQQPTRGTILSPPIHVHAVVDSWWSVSVVVVLEAALLRCDGLGAELSGFGWFREGAPIHGNDELASVSNDGSLLALWPDTGSSRAGSSRRYQCAATHALTGHTRRSDSLTVTHAGPESSVPPRIIHAGGVEVSSGVGARLLCVASGGSVRYSWRGPVRPGQLSVGRARPVDTSRGLLTLGLARPEQAGAWRCEASNRHGEATADVQLIVIESLTVTLTPKLHMADAGSMVTFTCAVRGGTHGGRRLDAGGLRTDANAVRWLHDGQPVMGGGSNLSVVVDRASRGHYQCEVIRGDQAATDSAELILGESPPELVYTFIEQAVLGGAALSLACRAVGHPAPSIVWMLDGQPISHLDAPHRSVSQWSPMAGTVESRLNLSLARPSDGGRYSCRATNQRGSTEHAARLNVYGPPLVRSVPPIRAVAGANTTVHCPYAGFPISEIRWQRGGVELPRSGRVSVSAEGTLRLSPAEGSDAGRYTCRVMAPHSHYAQNDLQIIVRIPPKISGFSFPTDLVEGSSVQALCGITSGDKPVYFSWLKDGHPIPPSLQVKEKSQDEFSFLIFSHLTSKHSGEYTCIVTNSAAEVRHSARLTVKVAPSWELEPQDTSALLGSEVTIPCATQGHPEPKAIWLKDQGAAGDEFRRLGDLDLQLVTLDNGTLLIASAGNYHEGRYKCQASNGIGRGLSKTITLTINEPAQLELSARNVTVKSGAPVSLTCDARGDPPIALQWTHDSKRLDLSTYRVTVSEKRSPLGVQSLLSVTSAGREDGGAYRCRAENAFGWDQMVIFLTVQEYPSAVSGLSVAWRGSRGVKLRWKGGASGEGAYRLQQRALPTPPTVPTASDWLHAPHLHLPATTLTHIPDPAAPGSMLLEYHLESLRPGTAYALRVAAVNEVGVSPYSQPVILRTLEEVPSEPPQNVEVQALVPGELSVKWKSPPQESWNGELLGYAVSWQGMEEQAGSERVAVVRGWGSSAATVAPLPVHGPIQLSVAAFNAEGRGPASAPLTVTALEGVPSAAPVAVRCTAMSPQSLRVWWEPIVLGALTGYDVIYEEADSMDSVSQWRRAVSPETSLSALRRGGNYSISVRGVTPRGPGPASAKVYCNTPEDVPGAPVDLRVVPDSESSVALSWLPPVDHNGLIQHYTVYYRPQRSGPPQSQTVSPPKGSQPYAVIPGLRPLPHEVWVTASTKVGEGDASTVIVCAPMHRAPAKIVSLERVISAGVGSLVSLPCVSAGAPPPLRHWTRGRPHSPIAEDNRFIIDGPLLLIPSFEPELADNYTCTARNPWGSDRVTLRVHAVHPPHAPDLRVMHATHATLTLGWQHTRSETYHTASITGYTLEYMMEGSLTWVSLHAPASARSLEVTSLACGSRYRARVIALSAIGPSPVSQEITAATSGGKTKPPPLEEVVTANSTCVRVNILAWDSDGCGARGWEVGVRTAGGSGGVTRGVPAGGSVAELCGLQPARWYQLRITPHSEAKTSPALYHFSTLTVDGERIPPLYVSEESSLAGGLAAISAAGALLAAVALGTALWRQRLARTRPPAMLPAAKKATDHPRSCQQLYSSAPGKLAPDTPDLYEISPYATFSMPPAPGTIRTPLHAAPLVTTTPGKRRSPINPEEYTLSRALTLPVREAEGSDSESSASADGPCRACSRPNTANGPESSSSSAEPRGGAPGERRRRRRPHLRQPPRGGDHERRDFTIHV